MSVVLFFSGMCLGQSVNSGTFELRWLSTTPGITGTVEYGVERSFKDPSRVIKIGDRYHVWATSFVDSGAFDQSWQIDHFVSANLAEWQFADTAVVSPGPRHWVYAPDVTMEGDALHMYFVDNEEHRLQIAHATAKDAGGPWSVSGAAIASEINPTTGQGETIYDPTILRIGDKWFLYFACSGSICYATSDYAEGPWARQGTAFAPTRAPMEAPQAAILDGRYHLFFTQELATDNGSMGHAISEDGIHWGYAPDGFFLHSWEVPWFVQAADNVANGGGSPGIYEGENGEPPVLLVQARSAGGKWSIGSAQLDGPRQGLGIRLMHSGWLTDRVTMDLVGEWQKVVELPVFLPSAALVSCDWIGSFQPKDESINGAFVGFQLRARGMVLAESYDTLPVGRFPQTRNLAALMRLGAGITTLELWAFGYHQHWLKGQQWVVTFPGY